MKSHSDKNTKQPKLRFPGFIGEWVEKRLGDVADITSSKRVYLSDYVESGIPFYRGKEITELKRGIIPSDILYISEKAYYEFKQKYGAPKKNDILITAVGTLGNILRINNDYEFYFKDGNLIWLKNISIDSSFLEVLLEYNYNDIIMSSIGSTQRALTIVALNKLTINTPALPEQKRIAEFLSEIDTKIEKLSRKKELTEQYKKGAMQKIFSQKIRFKDENGKNYPEWEEKRLGDVADIYDGTHLTPDYTSSGIPFYSVENVMSNNFTDTKYISEEVYIRECKRIKIEKGDILMTKIGDIGTSRYVDWEVEASFYVSLALIKQSKRYDSKYLSQYIMTAKFQENLHKKTIHVAFPKKINLGEIGNCYAEFPCLEEQKKIADFLTNIDKTIEQIQKELDMLKEFKKGLLQGMFV